MHIKSVQAVLLSLACLLIIVIALAIAPTVRAATVTVPLSCNPTKGGGVTTSSTCTSAQIAALTGGRCSGVRLQLSESIFEFLTASVDVDDQTGKMSNLQATMADAFVVSWTPLCSGGQAKEPPEMPAVWLADVCEPYSGGAFNAYGQMTLDSSKGTRLWVGSSPEGPWTLLAGHGPRWVLNVDDLLAYVNTLGLSSLRDLWFRVDGASGTGQPAHLNSLIVDRAALWDPNSCALTDQTPPN